MRRIVILAALAAPPATMTIAQAAMDVDGDGQVSFDEMQAAYPELTEEVHAVIDADGSGGVSEEEMQAAVEAGLILPAEG